MPDVNNVEALAAYGASLPLGSLLSAIAQVLQFPHPTWLVVSSMIGIPVAAFLTARAMQR